MRLARVTALTPVALSLGLLLTACRDGSVQIAYRPAPGTGATYDVRVHAEALTTLEGQTGRRTVADQHFTAQHRVLEAGRASRRVEVRLTERGAGEDPLTFVVHFDRTGQLTSVERIEGLPATALGELGLSEIFPAAATAPPERGIRPGDRWAIAGPVQLEPGSMPARVSGSGRLTELKVRHGRSLATVDATYSLPVRRISGSILLEGSQRTETTTGHSIADGVVEWSTAHTHGSFRIEASPPGTAGSVATGLPVPGRVVVDVRSSARRLR